MSRRVYLSNSSRSTSRHGPGRACFKASMARSSPASSKNRSDFRRVTAEEHMNRTVGRGPATAWTWLRNREVTEATGTSSPMTSSNQDSERRNSSNLSYFLGSSAAAASTARSKSGERRISGSVSLRSLRTSCPAWLAVSATAVPMRPAPMTAMSIIKRRAYLVGG
jgi:hypothetical protein